MEPEACLINVLTGRAARLGLASRPGRGRQGTRRILSISLGDTALFRLGGSGAQEPDPVSSDSASGDLMVLEGPSRHWFHGVDRILPGTSQLLPEGGRINLTLRRVTVP